MAKKNRLVSILAVTLTLAALAVIGLGTFSMRWSPLILVPALGLTVVCGILTALALSPAGDNPKKNRLRRAGAFTLLAVAFSLVALQLLVPASFSQASNQPEGTVPAAQTETPEPPPSPTASPTSTATPDPVLSVNLRDPATFPDWLSAYWWTGQWPDEAAQVENTSKLLTLYRQYLLDRGVEVEGLTDYGLYYRAARQANQDGWTLPADLDLTRRMFAGPQGASHVIPTYVNPDGGYEYGIYADFREGGLRVRTDDETIAMAQTSGEIITNTFGVNVLLQRQMPFLSARTPEGVLVEAAEGQFILILYYTNINLASGQRQDYYLPLSVLFSEATTTESIVRQNPDEPYRLLRAAYFPVVLTECHAWFCPWTEGTLRSFLIYGRGIHVTGYDGYHNYSGIGDEEYANPLVNGLEYARLIQFDRWYYPSPTPAP